MTWDSDIVAFIIFLMWLSYTIYLQSILQPFVFIFLNNQEVFFLSILHKEN